MDTALFRSLEWRNVGPHRGGRVVAVAGHPTEPGVFYFGGCAGGIWKTTSGGALWENVSDGFLNTSAIGALAVSDSNPEVIYAGTGESTIRGNVSHGDGVYKSVDSGHTWRNVGLSDTRHIGDIVIHPTNPDIVYVAALGHAWGPNEERGVFKSTDGGKSWRKVLYKSDHAGAVDLAMDPHHPEVLFATIWQVQRYPHKLWSGGEESGIWKSTDGGETWTDISHAKGLPKGIYGKIGVAASPARAGRVWVVAEAHDEKSEDAGGVYRSDDWGETWEKINPEMDLRRRPWYYMHIFADPKDADTLWILNLQCWKSTDGGKSFIAVPTPHGDNHGLWIDPRNPERMIESNDGGACVTFDGGHSWSSILNQPTAQFYHVTTDDEVPYHLYGSQQDNWAMRLPSIDFEGAISWKDYTEPGGGESGYIAVSRKEPHMVFGGGIGTGAGHGRMLAWNPKTGHKRNVTVWPEVFGNVGSGAGAEVLKYRFQWTYPLVFSPHDDDVLYACSNFVHRTRDNGTSWETISPDLTRNDPEKLKSSGGPITADNSGAEIYCTIFAFAESPHEAGVFWAGSDDGLVHISRDGGQSWQKVTPPELPEWALISIIEPSPHDAAKAYVTATNYKSDDRTPYIFRTNDYGATWTRITNGLPADTITRVVREDPNRRGLLYCGTETGVFVSFDDGANWMPFQCNLPVTPIHDLIVKGTDLIAATHGRAFWVLDDITPLYQMESAQSGQAMLFKPRDTYRFRSYDRMYDRATPGYTSYKTTGPVTVAFKPVEKETGETYQKMLDAGKNPPFGVIIHYVLPARTDEEVKLTILDAQGNELRTYSSKSENGQKLPAEAGANRFVWDFRTGKPAALEGGSKKGDPYAEVQETAIAPRTVPGEYQVRLTVGDTVQTQRFTVLPDPRLPVSAEDLQQQFDLKSAIRDRMSDIHQTVNRIRRAKAQVEAWEARVKGEEGRDQMREAAAALKDKLNAVEDEFINTKADTPQPGPNRIKEKLATLSLMIDESDDKPTQGAREVYELLAKQIEEAQAHAQQVFDEDVRAFNELVRSQELPAVQA